LTYGQEARRAGYANKEGVGETWGGGKKNDLDSQKRKEYDGIGDQPGRKGLIPKRSTERERKAFLARRPIFQEKGGIG